VKEEPVILLDEAAKDVGLADMVFNLIRQNLEQKPRKLRSFQALKSNVAILASDLEITITLAFRSGKLTIYNGIVGEADLKIVTDHDIVLQLSLIDICLGLPNYFEGYPEKPSPWKTQNRRHVETFPPINPPHQDFFGELIRYAFILKQTYNDTGARFSSSITGFSLLKPRCSEASRISIPKISSLGPKSMARSSVTLMVVTCDGPFLKEI
jgi:hypothetical protein